MYFHEAIARALQDQQITDIFGVLGDANLYMMDSFQRHAAGTFYSTSNEAGAVLAANGYARTSGGLGVATVTHGPAVTNTVTALVESVKDHTPVLVIAGDTAVVDRDNFQAVPQREVVLSSGAGFEQVRAPETVAADVAMAVRRAVTERRPIVLNVPIEFQWLEVEYSPAPIKYVARQAIAPDSDAMDAAAGIVASAARPVILAGQGAFESRDAILGLAERIGAPVTTTLRGKDLFRDTPHNLGICGTLAHEVGLETVMGSDCLIVFGASLNPWTTAEGSVVEGRRVVQVDTNPAAINQFTQVDVGVVGDSTAVAEALVAMLDEAQVPPTGYASDALRDRLAARRDDNYTDQSTEQTVDLRTAILKVEEAFPRERTLVHDGGRFIFNCFKLLHVEHPSAYVHTVNYGSIGLGMGNAVGAAKGAPGRPTLLVTGDGGFMLGGLAEFNTAVRHGIDLVVVLVNDSAYGAEHIQFRRKDMDPAISTFDWPDFGPVATALGGQGFTVHNLSELDEALAAIPGRDRPILIDIKIDPDKVSMEGH